MSKKDTGSGFTFGVALGAVVGTGAMLIHSTPEGKKLKKKLVKAFQNTADTLREKYLLCRSCAQTVLQLRTESQVLYLFFRIP